MAKAKKALVVTRPLAPQPKLIKGEVLPPLAARGLATREASNKFKFTKTATDRLPAPDPSGKQKLYWDEELTGFGLLVSGTTSAKSYIVQRKLEDGRTRRVTVGPVNDDVMKLDEARKRAGAILAQFYQGKDPKAERREAARRTGGKFSLQQALDLYIEQRRKKGGKELREKTKKDYRAAVEGHLKDWLKRPLREITPEMVLDRHAEIQSSIDVGPKKNARRTVKVTGKSMANGVMGALRAIWNFCAKPGRVADLPTNPVGALDNSWFENTRRRGSVEDKDLPAFYKAVDALPSRIASDYIKLLLFTGLRRREAAQLKWTDLDFDLRKIKIPEEVAKSGEELNLPMSDYVHALLVAREGLGRDGKYVFPANGKHGFIQEPKFFLSQVHKACGVRVSPHDLRRTFITLAESAEISPWALKALVNHSLGKGDVTAGYIQMTVKRLREPAQKVAHRIEQLCGIAKTKKEKPKARPKKQDRNRVTA